MRVCKNIEMLGGIGMDCNIYLVDGQVLVDTGTGVLFRDVYDKIKSLGYDVSGIKNVINTHCHFDHTGGNKKFRDSLKAKIAIHEHDLKALETGTGTAADILGHVAKAVTVDEALHDEDIIRTKNFIFKVISTPGHTPGSICLYEKDKGILISGDTLFSNGAGRTDLPRGNASDLRDSLEKISKLNAAYLLPGHGPPKVGGVSFLAKQILAGRSGNLII